jgi:ATP-dependent helicase/DNAse subunit B
MYHRERCRRLVTNMPAILYLTPTSTAARQHLAGKIEQARQVDPLAELRLLLPTGEAIRDLRCFLGDRLGLQFFQYYGLGRWILDQAGRYPLDASDVLITKLVQRLLKQMLAQGELSSFASVWDKPGFTQVLVEWLREMKSQGIHPEQVHAQALLSKAERDRQLALIYQRYQNFLAQANYADPDGLLWLAAEALESDPHLAQSEQPLIALGFDHFNPLQLRILQQMSRRCVDFSVYLPWDARRTAESLALSRLSQTRAVLEEALQPDVKILDDEDPPAPTLQHVTKNIFEHGAVSIWDTDPPAMSAVSAPSREAEVRYALREIKRLLLEGVSPYDVILLAPEAEVYRALVSTVSEEYGIPLQLRQLVSESPVCAALLNLLSLPPEFPRRQTLAALRSPYIRQNWLSGKQIELLDQLSRERPVVRGREQWRFALQPVEMGEPGYDEDDRGGPQLARRLGAEPLGQILEGLEAFFEHLTPPSTFSYQELTLWVQEALLGILPETEPAEEGQEPSLPTSLDLAKCCLENPAYAQRDMQALGLVLGVLRELVEAERMALVLMPLDATADGGLSGPQPTSWEDFRSELLELLAYGSLAFDLSQAGVRFGPLSAARDVPSQHLFLLGLSEGDFPAPPRPDVFYSPKERETHPLPLLRVELAADASLWWQVLGSARRSLTLLRPRLDENGALWLPSPFWVSTLQLVKGFREEQIAISAQPLIDQAACHSELLVALAASGARSVPADLSQSWEAAQRSYAVTRIRQSWGLPGIYEGFLTATDLRIELAKRYGPRHGWSASRLNSYGGCPFGFFAQNVLQLEALPDPQEGFDAMQRGSLLHALLEQLYADLVKAGLSLTLATQEVILERLSEVCQQVFQIAPQRYGFRPSSLWSYEQRELKRLLEALVRWECAENGQQACFWPYRQEETFGLRGSALPALVLEDVDGSQVRVHGVVDRVDRDEAGNLRVVDYKSGISTYSKVDIEQGLACQTALYAMAVEPHLLPGARVVESCYLLIPSRATSGTIEIEGRAIENETVQAAVSMALAFIRFIRQGEFPSLPGKTTWGTVGCRQHCDFSGLCRVNRQGIAKARRRSA